MLFGLFFLFIPGTSNADQNAVWDFGSLSVHADFPAGAVSSCSKRFGNLHIRIAPETRPINPSPWYCFKITSKAKTTVDVTLHYAWAKHRYWPKISLDGQTWSRLDATRIKPHKRGKKVRLRLDVGPEPLWVSAQEIIDNEDYDRLTASLAETGLVRRGLLGRSVEGRSIQKLETVGPWNTEKPPTVVLLGRQHPPEVTGALALFAFLETVLSDQMLARQFRSHYRLVIVPNLNPDGVAHGHWRTNAGGVDLNRDWGPFSQPETRLMKEELNRFVGEKDGPLALMLDFHSTRRNLIYTQEPEDDEAPADFALNWYTAIHDRVPHIAFDFEPTPDTDEALAKRYVHQTFGVPSIVLEIGDETDRDEIRQLAIAAAEAMMQLLPDGP